MRSPIGGRCSTATPRAKACPRPCRGKGRLGAAAAASGSAEASPSSSSSGPMSAQVAEVEVSRMARFASGASSARWTAAMWSIPTPSGRKSRAGHLRHHGRALRRDHAQERPRRAGQFRYLPDAAMNEAPTIEVHIVAEFRAAGRHGRAGTSAIVPAISNAILRQPASACERCRSTPRC